MNSSAALKAFVGRHGGAVCTSTNARAVLDRSAQNVFDFHLGHVVTVDVRLAIRWIDEEPQFHDQL